ncbi:MAG: Sir2 family NAD-dependent protein deacetylase [Planctomycetota bacterium]
MQAEGNAKNSAIETIAEWIRAAHQFVAFTGAGMSTESGIPDFRSPGGIWSQSQPVYYEDFLSSAAARHEYWRQKSISHQDFARAEPNVGHQVLAEWEHDETLQAIITQNIDGLHQLAGSRHVVELHGTARAIECLDCGQRFEVDPLVQRFLEKDEVPPCPVCQGRLKHATISFGQALVPEVLEEALSLAQGSDLFLAMGSSLVVEPAASLPWLAKRNGARLVILNRDPTPLDQIADLALHVPLGLTLSSISGALRRYRASEN